MKNLVFFIACVFILGCEGEPDAPPVTQNFECTFTNLQPKKYLKFTFDCLERKKKDSAFGISLFDENYTFKYSFDGREKGDNSVVIPKDILVKCGKVFICKILLYPYFPTFFNKQQQDDYVGTKLTYIMRIYKDEQLIYEKELKYPKEDYPTIKIDL